MPPPPKKNQPINSVLIAVPIKQARPGDFGFDQNAILRGSFINIEI